MNLGEGPQGDDYMFAALTDVEFGQLEEGFSMSEFFFVKWVCKLYSEFGAGIW